MANEEAIRAEGKIIEVLPNTLYRVELSNGHRLVAHVSGKRRLSFERMSLGDIVMIHMSPYDLSKGCITVENE
jgi:translation initiation factor IF-1